MIESKDKKVQQFLVDIMILNEERFFILEKLREIVFKNHPEIKERIMYGGIMFSLDSDFGGIFSYKNHVTFEFGNGYMMNDPKNILEGTGKFRRNIKIKNKLDIEKKEVEFFVKQFI